MECLQFDFPQSSEQVVRRAHVGVVSSGDMEVLMEPSADGVAHVFVRTSVNGFRDTWTAVLERFFSRFDRAVTLHINDAGATPGTVLLRLQQAAEALEHD